MPMDFHKMCFVVAPIGEAKSENRQYTDRVLTRLITPAISKHGLTPVRGDQISDLGNITSHVVECLQKSRLVVADLTGLNPNVMYELALRHAYGLPCVQCVKNGTALPFDIAQLRTVYFSFDNPDDLQAAVERLEGQISAALTRQYSIIPALLPDSPVLTINQARNVLELHQYSASYRMLKVALDELNNYEKDSKSFDAKTFYDNVKLALHKSRKLCGLFQSDGLGNLHDFIAKDYTDDELKIAVEEAASIITKPKIDSNAKRKKLIAFLELNLLEVEKRFEKALRLRALT